MASGQVTFLLANRRVHLLYNIYETFWGKPPLPPGRWRRPNFFLAPDNAEAKKIKKYMILAFERTLLILANKTPK